MDPYDWFSGPGSHITLIDMDTFLQMLLTHSFNFYKLLSPGAMYHAINVVFFIF